MKDMISQIVEMDKKARDVTQKAQQNRLTIEQEIAKIRERIREEHINRARKRIQTNQKQEQAAADKIFKSIQAKQKKISQKLDSIYKEHGDELVNEIVNRVIGEW